LPHYRPSIPGDAEYLAPRLRDADLSEIRAASGNDPLQSLLTSIHMGTSTFTMIDPDDGQPVGIFGLTETDEPFAASVWAMATPQLLKHPKLFMRESRAWVESVNDIYPVLFNYVDERNVVHIKWLQAMGFVFIHRHLHFGVERRTFIEFVRIRDV